MRYVQPVPVTKAFAFAVLFLTGCSSTSNLGTTMSNQKASKLLKAAEMQKAWRELKQKDFSCSEKKFSPMARADEKLAYAYSASVVVGEATGSHGSGVIIDKTGLIVTNHHVVDKLDKLKVTFYSAEQDNNLGASIEAKLIGYDEKNDVAVLKVDWDKSLTCLNFKIDRTASLGAAVYAIGHPETLPFTASKGMVSNVNRTLEGMPAQSIQTDATIAAGSSGGALVEENGMSIVGMNYAVYKGSTKAGFAIPAKRVFEAAKSILRDGYVKEVLSYDAVLPPPSLLKF